MQENKTKANVVIFEIIKRKGGNISNTNTSQTMYRTKNGFFFAASTEDL